MPVKGLAKNIVDRLVNRSIELSQGRPAGALGLINQDGYIDAISEIVDGGISGLPYRQLLSKAVTTKGRSLIEIVNQLPDNAVLISTNPGKTGLITSVGGINILDLPVVNIGVKELSSAGVGILYPKSEYFDLATESEKIELKKLVAKDMDEEREILKEASKLKLNFLDISEELEVVDIEERKFSFITKSISEWELPRLEVNSIDEDFVAELVDKSTSIEQGREVAAMGVIEDGNVVKSGDLVVGGMGYIPSRLLASGYTDLSGISLRQAYNEEVPHNSVIVHTHPGGTGVMHRGDAMAGPGMWGRPVIAIGHDKTGTVKGATVIEVQNEVTDLAEENEKVSQEYYEAETPEEEAKIRKRRFSIVQEYTDLCKPIEIT
ncbi:peptidase S7 [Sporohalobacter salinus]|uniref:peptidase S7 n=1 Tax=Sporohalobacter salinus TaxID=1494606 RepID=UPI001960CCCC|nr:peptidase S7 [Sporohalobacter salinus]MBM7623550.1 hypothetical protein [Sporohalobacter salinus]